MRDFGGKRAVVTGGGSGMGRELVRQLAGAGCDVALCDLSAEGLATTAELVEADGSEVTVTTHVCDVSDAEAMARFRDEVLEAHATDHVNLLFNNAGLSGGGSFVHSSPEAWEHCFDVCWGGVYNGCRVFLPLVIASDEGHVVNTSSVNGFWASLGPERPHTAYSAAKFAVKGFTEALLQDLRLHAPHVGVSVVMPGHIGTSIVENSLRYAVDELPADLAELMQFAAAEFRERAPMTAAEAATVILDAVRENRWRVLVGADAHALDEAVRADPERAYDGMGLSSIDESFRDPES